MSNTPIQHGDLSDLDRLFDTSTREVFRLETLPIYKVPGEWEMYERFLEGESLGGMPGFENILNEISTDATRGKRHRRVRVIPKPLTPYIRFESDLFYSARSRAGEDIRFISQERFEAVVPEEMRSDFYLFDLSAGMLMIYDNEGQFIRTESIVERELSSYLTVREALLRESTHWTDYTL
jgi:hypothetical protein